MTAHTFLPLITGTHGGGEPYQDLLRTRRGLPIDWPSIQAQELGSRGKPGKVREIAAVDGVSYDDPILRHGQVGVSGLHQHLGACGIHAHSTLGDIAAARVSWKTGASNKTFIWAHGAMQGERSHHINSVSYYPDTAGFYWWKRGGFAGWRNWPNGMHIFSTRGRVKYRAMKKIGGWAIVEAFGPDAVLLNPDTGQPFLSHLELGEGAERGAHTAYSGQIPKSERWRWALMPRSTMVLRVGGFDTGEAAEPIQFTWSRFHVDGIVMRTDEGKDAWERVTLTNSGVGSWHAKHHLIKDLTTPVALPDGVDLDHMPPRADGKPLTGGLINPTQSAIFAWRDF